MYGYSCEYCEGTVKERVFSQRVDFEKSMPSQSLSQLETHLRRKVMELMESIKGRYTFRGEFADRKPEKSDIYQIMEAARWAPSGHNNQPWEFILIDDEKIIADIARESVTADSEARNKQTFKDLKRWVSLWWKSLRASPDELREKGDGIYIGDRIPKAVWEELIAIEDENSFRKRIKEVFGPMREAYLRIVSGSPYLLVSLLDLRKEAPNFSNELIALIGIGAAIQNMRLVAFSLGIATQDLALPIDSLPGRERIAKLLGIPKDYRIVSILRFGYAKGTAPSTMTRHRRRLGDMVHENRFGQILRI